MGSLRTSPTKGGIYQMSEIRKILEDSTTGARLVSGDLLPLIYDELRSLAARKLSKEGSYQTLQPTALVHETWLRLGGDESQDWNDRGHFFRTAAQAMRRILVDRARKKAALKRGGGESDLDISKMDLAAASQEERLLMVDEVLERLELEHPERAVVVSLKFFGGLTNTEIAAVQGVTRRTVDRHWAYAKAWLFQTISDEHLD